MEHRGNRTILALTLLVVVWIVTYWIWQPRSERDPRVTFPEPLTNTGVQVSPDIPALIPKQPSPQPLPDRPRAIDPEPPKPQTQPQNPDFGEPPFRWYTVQPNDTAERIAARELGSAQHWRALARANPIKDISRLIPGDQIKIPLDPENPQGRPDNRTTPTPAAPKSVEYAVRSGDTLSGIAKQFYGSASPQFIDFIFAANRDRLRNKNDLRVGQTLIIPPKPTGAD